MSLGSTDNGPPNDGLPVEMVEYAMVITPLSPPPLGINAATPIDAGNGFLNSAWIYKTAIIFISTALMSYDILPITAQLYLTVNACKGIFIGLGFVYGINIAICAYAKRPGPHRQPSESQFYLTLMKGSCTFSAINFVCGIITWWISIEFPSNTLAVLNSGNMNSIKQMPDAVIAYTTFHSVFMWHMCGSVVAIAIMAVATLPTPLSQQSRPVFAPTPSVTVNFAAAAA